MLALVIRQFLVTFVLEPLNGPILLGCAMVIISVWAYKDDAYVEAKLRRRIRSVIYLVLYALL